MILLLQNAFLVVFYLCLCMLSLPNTIKISSASRLLFRPHTTKKQNKTKSVCLPHRMAPGRMANSVWHKAKKKINHMSQSCRAHLFFGARLIQQNPRFEIFLLS